MLIIVPLSRADVHRLDNWISCLQKYGGLESHTLIFVPTKAVEARAYEAAGKLGSIAGKVEVMALDMDSDLGWPRASNWQWFNAMSLTEAIPQPKFWMELDCLPVRGGWADAIAGGYTSGGTPFRGCVVKTPWKDDASGKPVESLYGPEDKMMCGCGIYPSHLIRRFDDLVSAGPVRGRNGLIADLSKGENSPGEPWDLHLRSAMTKLGMSHTDDIGDYWNTQNYRIEGGHLVCDPKETGNDGKPTRVHRAGIVNPAAVVIHGCKDESLATLILAGLDTKTLLPAPKPASEVKALVEGENPQIAELKNEMGELKKMLFEALAVRKPQPALSSTEDEVPASLFRKKPATKGNDPQKVLACLQGSSKRLRIGQVHEMTGIPLNKIKALCAAPDALFEAKGPLGWMAVKLPVTT